MATILGPNAKPNVAEPSPASVALGAVGVVVLLVGFVDLLLAWTPPRFGDPDWEFGTASAMFNNLPVPAMGLGLTLASAAARNERKLVRGIAIVALILALWALLGAVLFGLTLPLALNSIVEPSPRQALLRSSIKTTVQIVAYEALFLWLARFALRWEK
jgi:hypothetical protein